MPEIVRLDLNMRGSASLVGFQQRTIDALTLQIEFLLQEPFRMRNECKGGRTRRADRLKHLGCAY